MARVRTGPFVVALAAAAIAGAAVVVVRNAQATAPPLESMVQPRDGECIERVFSSVVDTGRGPMTAMEALEQVPAFEPGGRGVEEFVVADGHVRFTVNEGERAVEAYDVARWDSGRWAVHGSVELVACPS